MYFSCEGKEDDLPIKKLFEKVKSVFFLQSVRSMVCLISHSQLNNSFLNIEGIRIQISCLYISIYQRCEQFDWILKLMLKI